MAEEENKTEEKNPVPTKEEKAKLEAALVGQMKLLDDAIKLLTEARRAVGEQFAEVGNSDKMTYTDRQTREVKKWGICPITIAGHQKAANDAIESVKKIFEKLAPKK